VNCPEFGPVPELIDNRGGLADVITVRDETLPDRASMQVSVLLAVPFRTL